MSVTCHRSIWCRLFLLVVLSLGQGVVNAQATVVVDLEVRLQISPDSYVPPGTVAYVDVEIINHGPGTAVGPEVMSTWMLDRFPPSGFAIFPTVATPPCDFQFWHIDPLPGDPLPIAIQLYPPSLLPGQSVTCQVVIESISLVEYSYTLGWNVVDGLFGGWRGNVVDSNPDNNHVALDLSFTTLPEPLAQPEVIPATSPAALWGLAMLLVTSAGVMFWRRR
ncbi:MAG: hypothetical protein E6Q42_13870 [Dechloromonas sp.]|nr:MAG: hypothetical protein E6Q42_13870 [Dechloromonas sp.]